MKAMIFAAGLGTRLRPLTQTRPKALVEVDGVPLLEIVLTRLQRYGYRDIIINVHHFAERIQEFLQQKHHFGLNLHISPEAEALLDTGGGLKHASWFFDDQEPFLVHNVDILSDIDLREFSQAHQQSQALATLAVSSRESTRCFLFDQQQQLCGWQNRRTEQVKMARASDSPLVPLAFSGIHMISPAIFAMMPERRVFSIIDVYLQAAASEKILAFHHDHRLWVDVGKKENLPRAREIWRNIQQKDCTADSSRRATMSGRRRFVRHKNNQMLE